MEIIFYKTETGKKPAEEFVLSLGNLLRAKTIRTILRLRDYGHMLREPDSKPLRDGIFELRTEADGELSRVLYFFVVGNKAVLTHGFVKKTQKTPSAEIEKAIAYRKKYLEQQHKED